MLRLLFLATALAACEMVGAAPGGPSPQSWLTLTFSRNQAVATMVVGARQALVLRADRDITSIKVELRPAQGQAVGTEWLAQLFPLPATGQDWQGRGPDRLLGELRRRFQERQGRLVLGTRAASLRPERGQVIGVTAHKMAKCWISVPVRLLSPMAGLLRA